MIKIDLITGFLGSGKTTFIKKYARYFMDRGLKIGILENDYGAVNVDMLLLNELRGDNCELEMVAGGCDAVCHTRRFKTKLIAMAMSRYDRVLIEPSGVFDMDEFFDVLRDEPLDRWYEIGNIITVVDARLPEELSADSEFYLASQAANAGCIVLSHAQNAEVGQIDAVKAHLQRASEAVKLRRRGNPYVMEKNWSDLTEDDLRQLAACGYENASYVKTIGGRESTYSTVYFLDVPMTGESLRQKLPPLFAAEAFGQIHRIKGFYQEDGQWYQVNAAKQDLDIAKIPAGQQVMIIIGENLQEEKLKDFISAESSVTD